MDANTLFLLKRGGYTEIEVHGGISICDGNSVLYETEDVARAYPARSLLKPFQFLATELEIGDVADPSLFVAALGSVSASKNQVEKLKLWSENFGDLVSKLRLPDSFPMDESYRANLRDGARSPEKIYHTCYSKHLAILRSCLKHSWDFSTYLETSHPYHRALTAVLSQSLQREPGYFRNWVPDGCGLPSPVLLLREHARLYQVLAEGKGSALSRIRQAMVRFPDWIAGPKRLETELMQANPGKLIVKAGADGLLGISVLPTKRFPSGLGIAVKTLSGFQMSHLGLALNPVLSELGLKSVTTPPAGQDIVYGYQAFGKSPSVFWDLSPILNEETAVWPKDVAFKKHFSLETSQGDSMTLSSIETTVHIGTHTDSPVHFSKGGEGIEQVDIHRYMGGCQVIEVKKSRGAVIQPEDIQSEELLASRILFKTGSAPDPRVFNEDFVALSDRLIAYLASKGVVLVGIDTPSIDPFSSKDLPAHQQTLKAGMGILEGLQLQNVEEGVYHLCALPLKIAGADASPVRAILQ